MGDGRSKENCELMLIGRRFIEFVQGKKLKLKVPGEKEVVFKGKR